MNLDDPKWTAYALGELHPAERAALEAELRPSPDQQREVEEIRQCARWLATGLQSEPCPHLTDWQQDRLLNRSSPAQLNPAGATIMRLPHWRVWAYSGAVAAAACLVFFLLLPALQKTKDTRNLTRTVAHVPPSNAPSTVITTIPAPTNHGRTVTPPTYSRHTSKSPARNSRQLPLITELLPDQASELPVTNSPFLNQEYHESLVAKTVSVTEYRPPQSAAGQSTPSSPELRPLILQLPIPAFMGTPTDIPLGDRIEHPSDKPRPPVFVPTGTTNVALRKKVTSSDLSPIMGSLDLITDGNKEASKTNYVELHRRTQWVQIDLGAHYAIHVIVLWHAHHAPQVYRAVVVQLADDEEFTQNVRTVFNNDVDNVNGLGKGTSKEYFETYEGKLIQVPGHPARYVRAYSRGSSISSLNRYTEIEVYATPTE